MGTIVDYASLTANIANWTHRADLTSGSSPFSDGFIQNAQASIERDIPDLNFGNYIAAQESSYGPFLISNGVAPVPADWLGPKLLTVQNGEGGTGLLIFKAAAWLYDAYPIRQPTDVPAYVARDTWQSSYSQPQSFTATSGQTIFTLASTPSNASLLLVSLDGASLSAGISYTLSGNVLTLNTGATAGQILSVQYLSSFSGTQTFTATAGQLTFALANPSAAVIAVTVDGSVYTTTDYAVSGGYIQLTEGLLAGQVLTAYLSMGSVLIFGPYPDSDYSIQGTYYASAPVLSASSTVTSNWMVSRCPDCFLAACMREAGQFLKDMQMYQSWGTIYQQKLKALVDQDKAERWGASTLQIEVG